MRAGRRPPVLQVSLRVTGDGMGAKLAIEDFTVEAWRTEIGGGLGREGAPKLRAFLESQGIDSMAIRDDTLAWISETLARSPAATRAQDLQNAMAVDVALGTPPVHEEPQGLVFHHSYLGNAEAIAELRRKADAWGFSGIRDTIDPAYWVDSGKTVFHYERVLGGTDGRDVFGSPNPCLTVRERLPAFGKSLFLKDRRLVAMCEGALVLEAGLIKVLGADSLPTCQVVVASDKMSANLVLGGNYLNDWMVTMDMVHAALREEGVFCMVQEAEIWEALDRFNRTHLPVTLQIARGRHPSSGKDGRLEMLIDPEPEVPLPGRDGSIDFKNFSFFRTVPLGARIAKVLPPVPGIAGMDVHGEMLQPPAAKSFADEPGRNTGLEGFEPLYLVAVKPGRLAVKDGIPEVVEVLDVAGDVSLKTGNIEFPGAVKVVGDVHSRMSVTAVGDVEIMGSVEDSFIRSDGAIIIRGGVNGMGNGIVKSRLSSVTVGYLHNQRIESHANIVVFNEIINSQLFARKSIQMRFGRYSVLGSALTAAESMDLFNVGSESGNKTVLEVGKDFEVEAEMNGKNALLAANTQDLEFLRDMDDQMTHIEKLNRILSDEDNLLHARTLGAVEIMTKWIVELRGEVADLKRRLYYPGICEIMVRGDIHPGTVLKYRDSVLVVPLKMTRRHWIFRPNEAPPSADGSAA